MSTGSAATCCLQPALNLVTAQSSIILNNSGGALAITKPLDIVARRFYTYYRVVMFKRSQQAVSDSSKHWYQDKYQQVLTQRNVLALVAVLSLVVAAIAAFTVMHIAPLKSVEPYLIQVDDKTGIAQRVEPLSRDQYTAEPAVDRYFTATFLRAMEGYNPNIARSNYEAVRLLADNNVLNYYRNQVDATVDGSRAKQLGATGQRDIRVGTMAYIVAPGGEAKGAVPSRSRIIQAHFTAIEMLPGTVTSTQRWVATVTFEYADRKLTDAEQLINPLGYTVTSYQLENER